MEYQHLNDVRDLMLEEAVADIEANILFISPRLNKVGQGDYPTLLVESIRDYDDDWMANELAVRQLLNAYEMSHSRSGTPYTKAIPRNANETLAVGEFNRFYMRGVARLALANGHEEVLVIRGQLHLFVEAGQFFWRDLH